MSNRVWYFEIPAGDLDRAASFYATVFGRDAEVLPGIRYTLYTTTPSDEMGAPLEPGGINGAGAPRSGTLVAPVIVLEVEDVRAKAAEIEANGGTMLTDPADPAPGWMVYFRDPDGNVMAIRPTQPGRV